LVQECRGTPLHCICGGSWAESTRSSCVAEGGLELDPVQHLGRGREDAVRKVVFPLAPVYRRQGSTSGRRRRCRSGRRVTA